MKIRIATPDDAPQPAVIDYQTIRRVNAADYSQEQISAWAPQVPDTVRWRGRMASRLTLGADDGGTVAGFGELESDGRIDCFYCHHDYQRLGIGSKSLAALERIADERGLPCLYLESSGTARPFFEARGFVVTCRRDLVVRGVAPENYAMKKDLGQSHSAGGVE